MSKLVGKYYKIKLRNLKEEFIIEILNYNKKPHYKQYGVRIVYDSINPRFKRPPTHLSYSDLKFVLKCSEEISKDEVMVEII